MLSCEKQHCKGGQGGWESHAKRLNFIICGRNVRCPHNVCQDCSIAQVVGDIKELMIKQQHDMKKAFTGMSGPYVLKDEYCSAKVLQEFWCLPISKRTQVLEKMSTLQMKGPNGDQQRSEFKNIDKLISIFDKPHVDAIKEKVQRILNGNIRRGFDGVKSRLVSSDSRQQPHVILNPGMQRYVCGTPCFQFQTFKICSHTLAVAADNNELSQFIAYFIETYRSPNLAAAATA